MTLSVEIVSGDVCDWDGYKLVPTIETEEKVLRVISESGGDEG